MEIKNSADLRAAILELQQRKEIEKQQLEENFHSFKESLSPVNLIKTTISKVKGTEGLTGNIVKSALGLGAALVTNRLLLGKSPGFVRKILGKAIEMGIAGLVAKKSDTIKSTGTRLLKFFIGKKKKQSEW